MEEEKKVTPTPEPNPNGENDVNPTDIEDESQPKTDPAEEGKEGNGGKPAAGNDGGNPNPPKQSRETDAQNAERRRKAKEREEQRQKEREEQIRRQAVFEVKSGQVTAEELKELDLDKVEDEDQLFLVESLRKAKADGAENPQAAAYQALFKKQSKDKAAAKAKSDAEEATKQRRIATVAQDQANFKAKFGKTTAEVMKNEEEFMQLFGGLIDQDKGNFTELYTVYHTMKSSQREEAKREGAIPTGGNGNSDPNVEESDEEFKERYTKKYGHW